MQKATLIKWDGIPEVITSQGKHFTHFELQKLVGGCVEEVTTHKPVRGMYLNEDGHALALKANIIATAVINRKWLLNKIVLGDVVIIHKKDDPDLPYTAWPKA
jgi:hypothetical protein